MAKRLLLLFPLLSTILLLAVTESEAYSKTLPFQEPKPQKLTHLHFYFHDVITGNKPTALRVARAPTTNFSTTAFGLIVIADDPLTEGLDPSSKEVGRAQGMYAGSDMKTISLTMKTISLTMVFNFLFTEGDFKGSTFSLYGRNPIFSKVREMPIIGGNGAFRFARGYAQAKTYKIDGFKAIVEYNVFIQH